MQDKNPIGSRQFVLCFHVHQPRRLKKSEDQDERNENDFFDETLDRSIMERVARNCYIPTNDLLLKLIEQYPQLKLAFSISGTALEQMEEYAPEALESFKTLAATGNVDFLSASYYHSLSFLMEGEEFEIQILEHAEKIHQYFGIRPSVFRNTNLMYNDEIGRRISMMGIEGILTEDNQRILKHTCPHHLYEHRDKNGLKILLRNHSLSDDIAFHVALDWNLTAERFMSWLEDMPESEKLVTIALDYETFGEHHTSGSGIFDFLEHLLLLLAMQNAYRMATPSEIVKNISAIKPLSVPDYVTIDGCDLSDWVGNDKQREAFATMIDLESLVKKRNDPKLLKHWRYLQSSDHFFYMSDQAEHVNYLSPFKSTQEAFHHYIRSLNGLAQQLGKVEGEPNPQKINETIEAARRNVNAPVWALNIDGGNGYNI